jgi:hypothetical protein
MGYFGVEITAESEGQFAAKTNKYHADRCTLDLDVHLVSILETAEMSLLFLGHIEIPNRVKFAFFYSSGFCKENIVMRME